MIEGIMTMIGKMITDVLVVDFRVILGQAKKVTTGRLREWAITITDHQPEVVEETSIVLRLGRATAIVITDHPPEMAIIVRPAVETILGKKTASLAVVETVEEEVVVVVLELIVRPTVRLVEEPEATTTGLVRTNNFRVIEVMVTDLFAFLFSNFFFCFSMCVRGCWLAIFFFFFSFSLLTIEGCVAETIKMQIDVQPLRPMLVVLVRPTPMKRLGFVDWKSRKRR